MRNLTLTFLACGVWLWVLAGCSSTTSETATTSTTEEVTGDQTTTGNQTEMATTEPVPAVIDSVVTAIDSTSFPAMVVSNDLAEIQTGEMAKAKAKNAEVKKFADQMVNEHTKSSAEFNKVAGAKYTLSNNMIPAQQRLVDKLSQEKGMVNFDKEYMDLQISLHQQAVTAFELAAKSQSDPALKTYAAAHLPHLRSHLEMAKNTRKMVK